MTYAEYQDQALKTIKNPELSPLEVRNLILVPEVAVQAQLQGKTEQLLASNLEKEICNLRSKLEFN